MEHLHTVSTDRNGSNQENHTTVTHFILLGIPNTKGLETILFVVFLIIYLCTLLGNVMIITAILFDVHLHTPMYFFLCNLAIMDIGFSSVSTPKILDILWAQNKIISLGGCMTQVFFYHFMGCSECLLYTVMAYDRYVAICHPMRYLVIMNWKACAVLAAGTWLSSSIQGIVLTTLTFSLPYCSSNKVDHFFCDSFAVIKLACADTTNVEEVGFNHVGILGTSFFALILLSYVRIIYSIVRMNKGEGRHKAFSTCASHLVVVTFFYVPPVLIYTQPTLSEVLVTPAQIFNNIVTPMLNPVIYTLRNKDVKAALKKLMGRQRAHT